MAKLGSFFVEYRATADKYLADLKQMGKDSKEFANTLKPITEQAKNIGAGMAVAGGAVATAFVAMAKQAANYGDQIRDMSIQTGVSTQTLSGLKFAAEQSGTSFEGLGTALTKMSKSAFSAASGSQQQAQAFTSIGVSVKDATGHLRPMEGILGDVADRFAKMKDGTEKAALAQQMFGRSGTQMIEFLNQGKEGLNAFTEAAKRMGLEVGPEFAKASDDFNDGLNQMKAAQLGLSVTVGSVLLPPLTKAIGIIVGLTIEIRKFADAHPMIIRGVAALAGVIAGAGGLLLGLAAVLTIVPKLGVAFTLMTGPVGIAALAIGGLVAAFLAFPKFRGVVLDVLERVSQAIGFLGSYIGSVGSAIWQLAQGQFKQAWNIMSTSLDTGLEAAANAGNGFNSVVSSLGKSLDGLSFKMPEFASGLEDGVVVPVMNAGGKAEKLKDQVSELSQSFISTIRPADELGQKLTILVAKFDARDVVLAYGDEIIATAAKQREFGGAVTGTIAELEKQAIAMKTAADLIKANREGILDTLKPMPIPGVLNNGATGMSEAGRKALDEIVLARKRADQLSETLADLTEATDKFGRPLITETELIQKYGDEIRRTAVDAKALGMPLDANTRRLYEQITATDSAAKAIEKYKDDHKRAVESMRDDTKNAFAEMQNKALTFGNVFGAEVKAVFGLASEQAVTFRNICKTQLGLAQDDAITFGNVLSGTMMKAAGRIMEEINVALFVPLRQAFDSFFDGLLDSLGIKNFLSGLGKKLGEVLGGGSGSGLNFGGVTDGLLSKGLSKGLGALGIGVAAAPLAGAATTVVAGTAGAGVLAGTAGALGLGSAGAGMALGGVGGLAAGGGTVAAAGGTAAAGGMGATIGALATNPITIAVAGAIAAGLLINKFVGQGHKTADEFVQKTQNPFGEALGAVKDIEALETLWAKYKEDAAAFAAQGETEQKVVNQSFNTLNPLIDQLRTDLAVKPVDEEAIEAAKEEMIEAAKMDASAFETAVQKFADAVAVFERSGSGIGAAGAIPDIGKMAAEIVAPFTEAEARARKLEAFEVKRHLKEREFKEAYNRFTRDAAISAAEMSAAPTVANSRRFDVEMFGRMSEAGQSTKATIEALASEIKKTTTPERRFDLEMFGRMAEAGRGGVTLPAAEVADIPKMATGGFLERGGLALLHAGEMVVPASDRASLMSDLAGNRAAQTVQTANTGPGDTVNHYHFQISVKGDSGMTEMRLRDVLIPALKKWIVNDTRGLAATATAQVKKNWAGVVTT